MVDRLSGEDAPRLHLVSFNGSHDVCTSLSYLALECHGHFHSFSPTPPPSVLAEEAGGEGQEGQVCEKRGGYSMVDSDVQRVREEIVKAERVLGELRNLEHGALGQQLLEILREVSFMYK